VTGDGSLSQSSIDFTNIFYTNARESSPYRAFVYFSEKVRTP